MLANEALNLTTLRTVVFHKWCKAEKITQLLGRVQRTASIHFESKSPRTVSFLREISNKGFSNLSVRSVDVREISESQQTIDDGFQFLIKNCKGIQSISLSLYTEADKVLKAIGNHYKGLSSISLYGRKNITDANLKVIAENCKNLSHLDLSSCKRITDKGLKAIATSCTKLTSLNLKQCNNITDEGVKAITENCKRLSHLDLSSCKRITDKGLIFVETSDKKLATSNSDLCKRSPRKNASRISRLLSLRITH